jgi:hypothetical protein
MKYCNPTIDVWTYGFDKAETMLRKVYGASYRMAREILRRCREGIAFKCGTRFGNFYLYYRSDCKYELLAA